MKKSGLIILALLMAFSFGCGRFSQNNQQQGSEQSAPTGGPENGPGGASGMREGRGQFSPDDMAKRQTEQLGKHVTLTKDQEAKITEVNKKYAQKMMDMRGGKSMRDLSDEERQEMRSKMQEIQADREKEIKGLLNKDQVAKYDEYLQDMQKRMQERMQERRPQN